MSGGAFPTAGGGSSHRGAWAWIAFLPLGPIAVIAALPVRLARRAR
jgi:hypothetical protein